MSQIVSPDVDPRRCGPASPAKLSRPETLRTRRRARSGTGWSTAFLLLLFVALRRRRRAGVSFARDRDCCWPFVAAALDAWVQHLRRRARDRSATDEPVASRSRAGIARVQGGAVWAELDAATQEHGLALTGGRVSDTGVGGLPLGSGSGWLERMYGFTCESLISAEVVTASGEVVTASADENAELFWGSARWRRQLWHRDRVRVRLHPVGPILTAGLLLWPRAQAREVIRFYRDFIAEAPDEVGGGVALITAPPEPFVPAELRGQPAVGVIYCYIGPPADGEQAARPLREFGSPAVDVIQPMPYVALQSMLDGGIRPAVHEYFKVDWLRSLPDETIDHVVAQADELPAPFGQLILAPMGGAVKRSGAKRWH